MTVVPPLTFGTAGLRGPMRDGSDGMNVPNVLRASWAVARVLADRGRSGGTVVVGRDARHNSDEFAMAAAEVFAAHGFPVILLPRPLPTPVLAFAVRRLDAAAGVQITASHNPATDNGYKLYFDGGIQIVSPTDREIEAAMAAAPPTDRIARGPVAASGAHLVDEYVTRAAGLRRGSGRLRIALTPLHGVGGELATTVLRRAGFTDLHTVATQFDPDPDFPTVAFPNPEEPGATDALLTLAADVGADVAIALDPDADRCAVGIPDADGWRMLSGNETGWLLGDFLLSRLSNEEARTAVVASSIVSSQLLADIAADYGARHVETLTGFKWLARADEAVDGSTLVYAYEEAIGHCVDPGAVRDKDGISAAVVFGDLVAALARRGSSVPEALDELARRYGVHITSSVSARVDDARAVMTRLRAAPPRQIAGVAVNVADLADRADALIFSGSGLRVAVRPSGTEPKIKCYIEIRRPQDESGTQGVAAAAVLQQSVAAEMSALLSSPAPRP